MKGNSTVLGKRFRQSEGVQLNVRTPMSEPFEYRRHDVTGTKEHWVRYVRQESCGGSLPHLSLILDFVAQVEDQLPILSGEVLICRFSWSKT